MAKLFWQDNKNPNFHNIYPEMQNNPYTSKSETPLSKLYPFADMVAKNLVCVMPIQLNDADSLKGFLFKSLIW